MRRQPCNACAPVTVATWTPDVAKRNADRRVLDHKLYSEIKVDDRAAPLLDPLRGVAPIPQTDQHENPKACERKKYQANQNTTDH